MFSHLPESQIQEVVDHWFWTTENDDFWELALNCCISLHIRIRSLKMLPWKQCTWENLTCTQFYISSIVSQSITLKLLFPKCRLTLIFPADKLWREPGSQDKIIIAQICLVWGKGSVRGGEWMLSVHGRHPFHSMIYGRQRHRTSWWHALTLKAGPSASVFPGGAAISCDLWRRPRAALCLGLFCLE